MHKLLRNKKGVSPLIATIFLMAFAVGLGAVVMQFSEGLIGGDEKTACGADFDMVITNICMRTGSSLEFTIENTGEIPINGIRVFIEDMSGKEKTQKYIEDITEDKKMSKKIANTGNVQAVQFIPLVKEGIAKDANMDSCNTKTKVFNKDDISSCQSLKMKVKINVHKTIEQNASEYYEKVKKLKKKLQGAEKALVRSNLKLDKLETKEIEVKEKQKRPTKISVEQKWYEKFHWFYSSTNFLVIGGKDATSNEIVIKKHTDKDDLVFHTEMSGSPFFVIKSQTKKIDEQTIKETAQATVSYSKAWKLGISMSDVFYVKPDQVTKEAQQGEFVARGAFMIYGKKESLRSKLEMAIGMTKDNKVIGGPVSAIKKYSEKLVIVVPGKHKKSDIAKKIKKKIGGTLDEIDRFLPSGGCEIKQKYQAPAAGFEPASP